MDDVRKSEGSNRPPRTARRSRQSAQVLAARPQAYSQFDRLAAANRMTKIP